MAVHYPLNGIDLDFNRYEHRPLGPRDIMVNRIMEDYMNSRRVKRPNTYLRGFDLRKEFKPIKSRDRELGLDMYVLSRVLETRPPQFYIELELYWLQSLAKVATPMNLSQAILGLVERHHLESDPSVRLWLKQVRRFYPAKDPSWKKDMAEHLKRYQSSSAAHYHHFLYSGGHCVPIDPPSYFHLSIHPNFLGPPWLRVARRIPLDHSLFTMFAPAESPFRMVECLHQGKPRRPCSMPPPGAWSTTAIEADSPLTSRIIYFPRRPLSELDKISRRRSLSRTHIRAMFTDKPKWTVKDPDKSGSMVNAKNPCVPHGLPMLRSLQPEVRVTLPSRSFQAQVSYTLLSPLLHVWHQRPLREAMLPKEVPLRRAALNSGLSMEGRVPREKLRPVLLPSSLQRVREEKEKGSKDQFVGRTCQECLKNVNHSAYIITLAILSGYSACIDVNISPVLCPGMQARYSKAEEVAGGPSRVEEAGPAKRDPTNPYGASVIHDVE
ncbi:hypothetical protein AAE478_001486 [Parahypoxylon ruwenzoriense]